MNILEVTSVEEYIAFQIVFDSSIKNSWWHATHDGVTAFDIDIWLHANMAWLKEFVTVIGKPFGGVARIELSCGLEWWLGRLSKEHHVKFQRLRRRPNAESIKCMFHVVETLPHVS